ncbi:unnamed protein product [Phytophthora lilii]|uniref:Unnamed protein product n=1 Tax=Phytophthora lilii TaxID=2077276 RepID=A0A9W6TTI2_9STRA|nr:unnamed protein product [Phytophthora lilii]
MAQRLSAIEDAVVSVRSEIARGSEQQHTAIQNHAQKLDDLDEKLFALDKELLKLKLALPPTVKAQIPTSFRDQNSSSGATISTTRVGTAQGGDLGITLKLQELVTDVEAV